MRFTLTKIVQLITAYTVISRKISRYIEIYRKTVIYVCAPTVVMYSVPRTVYIK